MKIVTLIFITVFCSLSFARDADVPGDRDNATDCFDAIQKAYAETIGKEFAKGRSATPTLSPSKIVLSANGQIAWVNDKGDLEVDHPNGSVTVVGNSCDYKNRGSDTRSVPLGRAYMYVWQYGDAIAMPAMKACAKVPGVLPSMQGGMMMGIPGGAGMMMGAGGGMMGVGMKVPKKKNVETPPAAQQPLPEPTGTQK
jgi:hypothetical protein